MSRTVEQGDVFFFYRPRVGTDKVDELRDVQRFFFVLMPDGTQRYRGIVVGRKRLPDPREHERVWAFVAEVGDNPQELHDELRRRAYETRTRGVRVQPETRPAGEGRYAIVEHHGHTHLAYVLELPREPGPAQETFRIRPEASYIVAVRNPEEEAPANAGLRPDQRPDYPPELQERFGSRRFIALDDPSLLDYEGTELVLIGAAEDVESELGVELDPRDVELETADIFRRLRIRPGELPFEHGLRVSGRPVVVDGASYPAMLDAVVAAIGGPAEPGTGLGVAILDWDENGWEVHASEAGHTDFAPVDALQDKLLCDLRSQFGRVSYERVISGPGLPRILDFLARSGPAVPSAALLAAMREGDASKAITEFALPESARPLGWRRGWPEWVCAYRAQSKRSLGAIRGRPGPIEPG